jgi:FdhD protein
LEPEREVVYRRYEHGTWTDQASAVVPEQLVRLHVNGAELASLMCTPVELEALALGFLRSSGIIRSLGDVRLARACPSGTCVEVWLHSAAALPARPGTITSGCGGGYTFADLSGRAEPLRSDLRVTVAEIGRLMRLMQDAAPWYREMGGIHTAALARAGSLLSVVEDVGRHNTIDKLWGRCLLGGLATADSILLSTGRISSEMLHKAAGMGIPVVASRTSPTSLAVELAVAWNITLIGYVRGDTLNVYAGAERVIANREEVGHANS